MVINYQRSSAVFKLLLEIYADIDWSYYISMLKSLQPRWWGSHWESCAENALTNCEPILKHELVCNSLRFKEQNLLVEKTLIVAHFRVQEFFSYLNPQYTICFP